MDSNDRANRIDSFSINPQIDLLKIYDESGKETATVKYGKTYKVEVLVNSDGFAYPVALIAKCSNWNNAVLVGIKAAVSPPAPQISDNTVEIEFTPKASNVKDNGKFDGTITLEVVFVKKTDNTYLRFVTRRYDPILPDDLSEITSSKKELKVELEKIVVVIDPGHGVKPADNISGSQARMYKHKLMEKDDKGNLIDTGKQTEDYVDVNDLPPYVLNDPKKYIVDKKLDKDKCEYHLSFDIAELMIPMLRNKGYTVITTRKDREYWETGKDKKYAISFRNEIANKNKADYFISLHADGAAKSQDIDTTRGAHVCYNKGDKTGEDFAKDLFKYYDVSIPIMDKHPSGRDNIGVVGNSNKTKYKALIEFGFMAQPKDAHIMHTQQSLIAEQIVRALVEHINNKFE